MEHVTENIYEWTGHRELTEEEKAKAQEMRKELEKVFGEPIEEKEVAKLTNSKQTENEEEIER